MSGSRGPWGSSASGDTSARSPGGQERARWKGVRCRRRWSSRRIASRSGSLFDLRRLQSSWHCLSTDALEAASHPGSRVPRRTRKCGTQSTENQTCVKRRKWGSFRPGDTDQDIQAKTLEAFVMPSSSVFLARRLGRLPRRRRTFSREGRQRNRQA